MMNYIRVYCFATFCFQLLGAAQAQESQPAKLYERGVNAYFDGRAYQADSLLSEAIQGNSGDPRAYYFRALSLLRAGRAAEARGDMLVGATLETQSPQRQAIGAALERVQGCDRLMLEQFRCYARRDAVIQASATSELPGKTTRVPSQTFSPTTSQPQAFKESDAAVLRERRIVPLEELLRPGGPQTVVEDPQANAPSAQPTEKAAAPSAPTANPFEDDTQKSPAPAAKPAAEPPKIPPQTTPVPTPPASTPAKPDENPFG
jgi:hypothetical protein